VPDEKNNVFVDKNDLKATAKPLKEGEDAKDVLFSRSL